MSTLHTLAETIAALEADLEVAKREFGECLRRERIRAGIKLEVLGRAAGYNYSHVSKIERGWALVTGDGAHMLADAVTEARRAG